MHRRVRVLAAVLATAALIGLTACSGGAKPAVVPSDDSADPAVVVTVTDNRYDPANVEIEVGQAVRWEFRGSMEHDVVADGGSFVSELQTSGSYTFVFTEAGEWAYDCSIHPEMRGTVTVR